LFRFDLGAAQIWRRAKVFLLTIPSVRNVANVGEEVTLQIDFVANAQG
jgi:hypothetical protein